MMHTETSKKLLNRNTEDNMNKGRCRHSICPEARQEVAREIFEDIDGKMLFFFPASSFKKAPNTIHYSLLAMLAELKKKYTELKE